jgi:hypothetical protein
VFIDSVFLYNSVGFGLFLSGQTLMRFWLSDDKVIKAGAAVLIFIAVKPSAGKQ